MPRSHPDPHPDRLPLDHPHRAEILARHEAAMVAGATSYVDPGTGYQVFTAAHLAATGRCCESGCRHCPFLD